METAVKYIQHPYITIDRNIRGGQPVISGTGIRVLDIAIRYEIIGMLPEDIIIAFPHLNLSQVHDALSHYYENKNEIDRKWRDALRNTEALKKISPSTLEKKIGRHRSRKVAPERLIKDLKKMEEEV